MNNFLPSQSQQDPVDISLTGTQEQFWVFSQVSQWGYNWKYSDSEYLNKTRQKVIHIRSIGIKKNYSARMVHFAQLYLWRHYLKKADDDEGIFDVAFNNAAQLLEMPHSRDSQSHQGQDQFKQYKFDKDLDFNLRIKHPSNYLSLFVTDQFNERQYQLAECIISDSFLCPCCLLYDPITIAEGAAAMAAGMTNQPDSAAPRGTKSLSFIKDMKFFYRQTNSIQTGNMQ